MSIEERLKRIEDKLGMSWSFRDGCCDHLRLQIRDVERAAMRAEERSSEAMQIALNAIDLHNEPTPKHATIKIGPMSLDHAHQIRNIIHAWGLATVDTDIGFHSGFPGNKASAILTITGPAE